MKFISTRQITKLIGRPCSSLVCTQPKDEVTSNASIHRNKIVRNRDRTSIYFGMNADLNNRLVLIVQVTLLLAASTTKKKILYVGWHHRCRQLSLMLERREITPPSWLECSNRILRIIQDLKRRTRKLLDAVVGLHFLYYWKHVTQSSRSVFFTCQYIYIPL